MATDTVPKKVPRKKSDVAERSFTETILIVDDEKVNRIMLSKLFEGSYNVAEAGDGAQALEYLHGNTENITVILDIMMPVMDGYEVLEEMRRTPSLSRIPVIVVTANGDDGNQIKALDLGAQDIIAKPYSPDIVKHRVENIVSRRKADQIAEQNRLYEHLLKLSETDEKTGIYNRSAFCRKTAELIQNNPRKDYVICRWDIDRFKVYNDMFGVAAGDELLAKIGGRYRENPAGERCVYGHWEADHFVACYERNYFTKNNLADSLQDFLSGLNDDFNLVARLGVYPVEDRSVDVSLMCDRALLALYSTKNSYSQRVAWYDENMRNALLEEQSLIATMETALREEQFIVYLQPQYDYATGALHGAEALVRWMHPDKGMIPPFKFISLFEKNGFICRMDQYIWEQVCKLQRKWLDAGYAVVPVSVNLSRLDIYNLHLCEFFGGLLKKYNLDPSLLRLEITETAYMDNPAQLIKTINSLRELGFSVEMDDFGSGYSSLNTLKEVPVDTLKMDMKFLEMGKNDSRSGKILTSIVRMASWLELPVIAEGVETSEQADYLKSLGCVIMQGYLFARPMPVEDYEKLLIENKPVAVGSAVSRPKLEGTIDFLDASNQATLMFNVFTGGAMIVEYDGKNAEALRVNDRFYEIVQCTAEEYATWRANILVRFTDSSRRTFVEMLEAAERSGEEVSREIHSTPVKSGGKSHWTHCRTRYLTHNGENSLFYVSVEEITERKELDEIRVRLSDIIDNVPAGIAIYEMRDNAYPLFVSDKTCEMLGYTREEFDERITGKMPASGIKNMIKAISQFKEGESHEHVVPATRKDGSHFMMRIVSTVYRRNNHDIVYATLFDVTEEYERRDELSTIVSTMPGGFVRCSADGKNTITYTNDNFLNMLGYTREEFESLYADDYSRLVWHEDLQMVQEKAAAIGGAVGTKFSTEYRLTAKGGVSKWVHITGDLSADVSGKKWFYFIVLDIDKRYKLEKELEVSSRRVEAVVSNTPGGVMVVTINGSSQKREYASEGVARLFGYTPEELSEQYATGSVFSLVHPEDVDRVERAVTEAVHRKGTMSEQYRIRRKDGSYLWVNLTANPVEDADGVLRFYCSYSDISEQMQYEKKLRLEKQKLEYAVKGSKLTVWEYDIVGGVCTRLSDNDDGFLPEFFEGAPYTPIETGYVAPESAEAYLELHDAVMNGEPTATADVLLKAGIDGKYNWNRIVYQTVFLDGKPISAIGTAVDITSETEAIAKKREMDLALEASSLYLWTYDLNTETYPVVNKNATKLGIGRIVDGVQCGLADMDCLTAKSRRRLKRIVSESTDKATAHDGTATLRMKRSISGMEWMRISYAVIYGEDAEPRAVAIVGEDVSDRIEYERRYEEAVNELGTGNHESFVSNLQIDLSNDTIEVCRGTFTKRGMKYTDAVKMLLDRVFTDKQQKKLASVMNIKHLREAFEHGEDTFSLQYQRIVDEERGMRWVRTVIKNFRDPASGDLKSFQYTVDIDREMTDRDIMSAVAGTCFEMLGVVFLETEYLHCYRFSGLERQMEIGIDCAYRDGVVEFIDRYIIEEDRTRAKLYLSLEAVCTELTDGAVYNVVFPIDEFGVRRYKKWTFCWLNDEKAALVITRADVSGSEALRVRSAEMMGALKNSNTVVCHYDIRSRTLSLPEEYMEAFGTSSNIENFPYCVDISRVLDRSAFVSFFERIIAGEDNGDTTVQVRYVDGSRHWKKIVFATSHDDVGNPTTAVLTIIDVTEQRENEIENERNKLLMEQFGIALFDYDVKSDTLVFEAKDIKQGMVRKEYNNYYVYVLSSEMVHPDSAETLREIIRSAREKPVSGTAEYRSDNWGTGYRWCRINYSSVADENGAVYRVVGQISDVQHEKDQEVLLKELNERIGKQEHTGTYDAGTVATILRFLYESDDTGGAISKVLELLGSYFKVSRAYIFEDDATGKRTTNTFEWCASGVPQQIAMFQNISYEDDIGVKLSDFFDENGLIFCGKVEDLPEMNGRTLAGQAVESILCCALIDNGRYFGYIGFDDCTGEVEWTENAKATLSIVSMIIGSFLSGQRRKEAESASRDLLSALAGMYDEVYEIDWIKRTVIILHSKFLEHDKLNVSGSLDYALERWYTHIESPEERKTLSELMARGTCDASEEPVSVKYTLDTPAYGLRRLTATLMYLEGGKSLLCNTIEPLSE